MFNQFDIIRATDSYKASHWRQYPPTTTNVYSYFESRGKPDNWDDYVVFFGLQYFLKQYLTGTIVTSENLSKAEDRWGAHFGSKDLFNKAGWERIINRFDGKLPVSIQAVPEGSVVPTSMPLMTIENTDPESFWLTNWLETVLVEVWYASTIATNSRGCKQIIANALEKSGDLAGLPFKLHDFGFRGVTCPEQAAIGGAAHLVNFMGTDTFIACDMLMDFYGANMPGFSIPASEHSTITSWGESNEISAFRNMLNQYPTGLVACVSDSFDIMRAVNQYWGKELKERILSREGTLVVRPDSGEPVSTVLQVINGLGKAFGTETNGKGYKVLPPQIRMIQGDGIDKEMLKSIVDELIRNKWSIDNIAFGSGGGLLQQFNRDTLQFAFKCSWAKGENYERDVYKDPVTASTKKSKRGRFSVVLDKDGKYHCMPEESNQSNTNQLQEVYRDGNLLIDQNLDGIRKRADL
jgi:nicotinamide phosphoribosyltransferase